jgi:hypothetical protein
MKLTAFFSQMPKGDLHHHFSGSIYEPILEDAIAEDFYQYYGSLGETWKLGEILCNK